MALISNRAEILRHWQDFLNKYLSICCDDPYDEAINPEGYINLGTAINNMCNDIIHPKIMSSDVWVCNKDVLQYCEGRGIYRVRKALAAMMTEFFETSEPINPDDLFCALGATGCMDILAHCLADSGDVFLTPTPLYGRIYTIFMQRSHVEMCPIPIITEDNIEDSPVLTIEKVEKAYASAIDRHRVVRGVFLINPNNPLGDVYSPELLMEILEFCKRHSLHVVTDELYALSVFPDGPQFHSILKFSELPDPDRTHVIYGMSKDFGVAGLRIGVIHTKCKLLQNCLKEILFLQDIPFPVMDIAARFFEDLEWCKMYVSAHKQRLAKMFKYCESRLNQMGLKVRNSGAAFFLWVDFRSVCGSESFSDEIGFFLYLIENAHLYIVPGKELFCAQPGWFRIVYTGHPDHVETGFNRLEKAIEEYRLFHSKVLVLKCLSNCQEHKRNVRKLKFEECKSRLQQFIKWLRTEAQDNKEVCKRSYLLLFSKLMIQHSI